MQKSQNVTSTISYFSHKSTIINVGKAYITVWIPGGKRYRTSSRRLAITLYLNKFYYLRFIFWAKAHYLKQIKYEKSKYINKRNNDLKLLHKNLSLFRRMSLHCKHSRFSGLPL